MDMNKNLTSLLVAGALAAAQAALANSTPIADGQTVNPLGNTTVSGGTLLGNETTTLVKTSTGTKFPAGTIHSWVYSGDANNTLGGLTFVYQLNIASGSSTFADSFADSGDFEGFLTSVGIDSASGSVTPASANRDTGIITWVLSPTHVTAGTSSVLLIVQTDAKKFQNDAFNVHDGGTSSSDAYVPLAVPDGGLTVALLGGGLMALAGLRRKLS